MSSSLLHGCKNPLPEPGEYPELTTVSVTDIDSTGATFSGKFLAEGISPVSSFGFYWDNGIPEMNKSDSVVLGHTYKPGIFRVRIEHSLANHVVYNVRAFAVSNGVTVYGNTVQFKSNGSLHSKWSLESDVMFEGISNAFGCDGLDKGFILFQWSQFYTYDPVKKGIKRGNDIPIPSTASTRILPVSVGNDLFLFSENKNKLFKLQDEYWVAQSQIPFGYWVYGGHYQAVTVSESIYIVSTYKSYKYDTKTNVWTEKKPLSTEPGGPSEMGADFGEKAYLITRDKSLWEYDTQTDSWSKISTFPGELKPAFVSLGWNNTLFFGQTRKTPSNDIEFILWSYDVISGKWQLTEKFPVLLKSEDFDLFGFVLKDKLYIGIGAPYLYRIWKYDPQK